jgi:hypothetical protein
MDRGCAVLTKPPVFLVRVVVGRNGEKSYELSTHGIGWRRERVTRAWQLVQCWAYLLCLDKAHWNHTNAITNGEYWHGGGVAKTEDVLRQVS